MRIKKGIQDIVASLVIVAILFTTTSCGTILYPERRGQRAGRIDAGVAVLDGIGLLFFLVPGVIAFAVDFATGAIYLPSGSSSRENIVDRGHLAALKINEARITQDVIESLVQKRTGYKVDLGAPDVRVSRADLHGSRLWSPINQVLTPAQLAAFRSKNT